MINDINFDGERLLPVGVTLHGHSIIKKDNAIEDTRNFCQNLMSNEVSVIIIDDRISSEAIIYTASLYNIPTIGLTNRESIFSDKSLYGSEWAYNQDTILTLADATNGFDVESTIEYNYKKPYLVPHLERINARNSSCRVFVLYTDQENSMQVLDQISALHMYGSDYVWLVSEQALAAPTLPVGSLGVRYRDWNNVKDHITDSLYVISYAIKSMHWQVNFTLPPSDCHNIGRRQWLEGDIFYDYLRTQTVLMAKTGKTNFDERGDRLNGNYDILNLQYERRPNGRVKSLVTVGQRHFNTTLMKLEIDLQQNRMVWPGNQTTKPMGYASVSHLKIATIAEKPFVWVLPADKQGMCTHQQIPCPIRKKNSLTGEMYDEIHCCEGYCMDLLQQLASQMNFTYSLYQVEDGLYGTYTYNQKTGKQEWTGLLGELYYGRADMVVAALTITPERSIAIDFTKPFKYQGITILQKRQSVHRTRHPLTSFLQPFQDSLWVSVFVAVHVVALSLYLLDRFSPFGRYKLPNCETITEEDALNLSSAIWFAWGVLFNSGIGEGTPRSFSGRVLGMVWAGFAMIVVASYTANLAAFLVLDRPETALSGINDPRLRNFKEDFNYSTVRGSAVEMYFRRQVELAPIYKRMADISYTNAEEAIVAVKNGNLKAFIWDSSRLEYETAKDCELSISGEHFGRSGYAIGLRKGQSTYWKDRVTLQLLGMHEVGFMEDLDNKWILLDKKICETKTENFPPTLGLKNMAGVFILLTAGIIGGIALIMFEIFYKQHQTRKLKRLELAKNAVDKWKEMVENRKLQLEQMNLSARARYKERHQVHRRGQLRNSASKSYSSDKSLSVSSSEAGTNTIQFVADLNKDKNGFSGNDNQTGSSSTKKPIYLELKQTNSPAKASTLNSATTMSTFRRMEPSQRRPSHQCHHPMQEQHPMANARIYHPTRTTGGGLVSKPKLRREYSMSYEQQSSDSMSHYIPYEMPPDPKTEHGDRKSSGSGGGGGGGARGYYHVV
ncbi:hypothetical protein RDWZM_006221 [Blomia tropicalis]|uniref:Glutamate [NMDA] receptor subunit 1 n=1 Tax=Blomia tropicalis TaxID=40697 RepID=A0A9Q0M7Q6_BLOTA|nr:hypothetical protein RDWZM_006221 [Blomia tropicalis]